MNHACNTFGTTTDRSAHAGDETHTGMLPSSEQDAVRAGHRLRGRRALDGDLRFRGSARRPVARPRRRHLRRFLPPFFYRASQPRVRQTGLHREPRRGVDHQQLADEILRRRGNRLPLRIVKLVFGLRDLREQRLLRLIVRKAAMAIGTGSPYFP